MRTLLFVLTLISFLKTANRRPLLKHPPLINIKHQSRCKVDEESHCAGRELRRSRTASRLLPAEFTVEQTRTFAAEDDESRAPETFEVSH